MSIVSSSQTVSSETLTIRPSSISTWLNCPWKWYKHHIEGVPSIPNVKMTAGTATHKGAEVGYTEKIKTGELPPVSVMQDAAVEEFQKKLKEEDVIVEADEDPGKYEKIVVENISLYQPVMEETRPKAVEKKYRIEFSGYEFVGALEGTADIIEDGGIVDIKTTLRKAVPSRYIPQLSAYAMLAEEAGEGKMDRATIHNIVNGKAVYSLPAELAKAQTRYLLDILARSVDDVLSGRSLPEIVFRGTPSSNLCDRRYCKLYDTCPFVKGVGP